MEALVYFMVTINIDRKICPEIIRYPKGVTIRIKLAHCTLILIFGNRVGDRATSAINNIKG